MERYCEMKRCLIVDEDRDWRGQVQDYLSSRGFEIQEADNVTTAYEKYICGRPDMIFVGTPDPSDFVRQLMRNVEGVDPIVILCPDPADIGSLGKAIWNGATDYMIKPYSQDILDAKLRQTGML
ncbi:MAG: response regulator [Anderseniella sp.]